MASATNGKSKKHSKIIILKLAPSVLQRFSPIAKSPPSGTSTPLNGAEEPNGVKPALSVDNASDSNSTPAPGQDASSSQSDATKKRKTPSTAPRKSLNLPIDTMQKPRGKPGPKKKPRLEDGTIDHTNKPVITGTTNHKLGPKANTGAINAGLRALDRTGTPCRKWQRNGFQLKSFTGHTWELTSWKGGENSSLSKGKEGEPNGESKDVSMQSSSDAKPNGSDVAMSNAGDAQDHPAPSTPAASSPAPIPTIVAAQG